MPAMNTHYALKYSEHRLLQHHQWCGTNLHEDTVAANADNAVVLSKVEGRRHLPGMSLALGL